MEHFVTLFDSLFLPQGLALHISMERHVKDYTLWILCVDDCVHAALTKLQLPNVRLLQLSKLETEELLRVKSIRSNGEYCWTLTPFAPRFVFEADPLAMRVTYLDADMWFRKNPLPIFQEFERSCKSVMITEHAYAPEYDHSDTSGRFCVQFVIFNRNSSEEVRFWWECRCLEWCYARNEDGKYGDQMYLDVWPNLFPNDVHILQNQFLILAPWNVTRFPYNSSVVYHFHGLRVGKRIYVHPDYRIYNNVLKNVYLPYVDDIRDSIHLMQENNIVLKCQPKSYDLLIMFVSIMRGLRDIFFFLFTKHSFNYK